jgi:predicted HTH domain antitoxin
MSKMPVVQVRFDTDVLTMLRRSPEEMADELRLAGAIRWYALGLVSQGKGAEIAGLSRAAFIDALSASGVSPVQETPDEIREALARG